MNVIHFNYYLFSRVGIHNHSHLLDWLHLTSCAVNTGSIAYRTIIHSHSNPFFFSFLFFSFFFLDKTGLQAFTPTGPPFRCARCCCWCWLLHSNDILFLWTACLLSSACIFCVDHPAKATMHLCLFMHCCIFPYPPPPPSPGAAFTIVQDRLIKQCYRTTLDRSGGVRLWAGSSSDGTRHLCRLTESVLCTANCCSL